MQAKVLVNGDALQVQWLTNPDDLIKSDQFRLAFRLRSRPLADVNLNLKCEAAEVVAQLTDTRDSEQEVGTQTVASEELGRISVTPADWQVERSFLLRATVTKNMEASSLTENGTFRLPCPRVPWRPPSVSFLRSM